MWGSELVISQTRPMFYASQENEEILIFLSGIEHWPCLAVYSATVPVSEGEVVVWSPTNMAVAKIAAVDFIDLY